MSPTNTRQTVRPGPRTRGQPAGAVPHPERPPVPEDGPARILAVIDPKRGNNPALERAVALARTHDAELFLCSVLGTPVEETVFVDDYPQGCETADDICRFERGRLAAHAERIAARVRKVETSVVVGVPHFAVARFAASRGVDLLVKEAACVPEFSVPPSAPSDETDRSLLKTLACPVLIERREGAAPSGPALAVVQPGRTLEPFDATDEVIARARWLRNAGTAVHYLDLNAAAEQGGAEAVADAEPVSAGGNGGEGHGARRRSAQGELGRAFRDTICPENVIERIRAAADTVGAQTLVVPVVPARGMWKLLFSDPAERLLGFTRYSIFGIKPSDFARRLNLE